jgi:protocatechuate 3,4-dioxygenase alpha subunit
MTQLVASPSQTTGPLWGFALMFDGCQHAVDPASPGAVRLTGRVTDGDGRPVAYPDAFVEVWQGDQWARGRTDADGRYEVVVAKPDPARAPDGRALAPYLNLAVFARGLLKQALTRVYFPDETSANAADPVLALVPQADRAALVAVDDGGGLTFDVVLQGDGETPFFAF